MFNIFKKNKYDSKKGREQLVRSIQETRGTMTKAFLIGTRIKWDEISNKLSSGVSLDKEQADFILDSLNMTKAYPDTVYEHLHLNRCNHILKMLSGEEIIDKDFKEGIQIEDDLQEKSCELASIEKQIEAKKKQMKRALDNRNKYLFDSLNGELKTLQNRYDILNKVYQDANRNFVNFNKDKDMKKAKKESERSLNINANIDVNEFTENVEFMTYAGDEIAETSRTMDEVFSKNFGGGSTDSEYERALEEMLLNREEESTPTNIGKNKTGI